MLKHPVCRVLIAVAVALVSIALLGRVLLSLSWLTTLSWAIAWLIALAAGRWDRSVRRARQAR